MTATTSWRAGDGRIEVVRGSLDDLRDVRDRYRDEMACQIVHDSLHARPGWTTEYRITLDGEAIGYGSVAVGGPWTDAPALYEFFVERAQRMRVCAVFERLVEAAGVARIETQSNDRLLTAMLLAYATELRSEAILFEDGGPTRLHVPGVIVRAAMPEDAAALEHAGLDPSADWVAVIEGTIVAAGGVLYHYNRPYGDVFFRVAEPFRQRGIGAYLAQELKRMCRASGSVPAARCGVSNEASRRTLQRAGFVPCGGLLAGTIRR